MTCRWRCMNYSLSPEVRHMLSWLLAAIRQILFALSLHCASGVVLLICNIIKSCTLRLSAPMNYDEMHFNPVSLSQILFCLLTRNLWYLLLRFVLSKVDHKLELNYWKFWAQSERKQTLQHVRQCGPNVNEEANRKQNRKRLRNMKYCCPYGTQKLSRENREAAKETTTWRLQSEKWKSVVQKQSHFSCHKPKSEMKRNTEELRNEIIAFNYSCYTPCKRLKTDEVYKMCRFAGKGQIGRSRLHNLNMAIVNYKLNLNLSRSESRNTKIAWN